MSYVVCVVLGLLIGSYVGYKYVPVVVDRAKRIANAVRSGYNA